MNRIKSRKFWLTIVVGVLVLFSDGLGLDISPDQIESLVMAVSAYVIGQGYVDGKALEGVRPNTPLEAAVIAAGEDP